MKSIKMYLMVCVASTLFFSQCKKENEITANAHFYTTDVQREQSLYLFIDNVSYGKLPKRTSDPDCTDAKIDSLTLSFQLKSGKYDIEMKDSAGTVYNSSRLKFSENKTEAGGSMGSMSVSMSNDHCLRVALGSVE